MPVGVSVPPHPEPPDAVQTAEGAGFWESGGHARCPVAPGVSSEGLTLTYRDDPVSESL